MSLELTEYAILSLDIMTVKIIFVSNFFKKKNYKGHSIRKIFSTVKTKYVIIMVGSMKCKSALQTDKMSHSKQNISLMFPCR